MHDGAREDSADSVRTGTVVGQLRRSLEQSSELIARVPSDRMDGPTPCPKFDVRTLIGHMVFAAERVGAAGHREPLSEASPVANEVGNAEWGQVFSEAGARALQAWEDPRAMEGDIVLPFGTFPATEVAQIYAVEQATHAWDLAAAVGARSRLDEKLAEALLPVAVEVIRPEYRGPEPMPFAVAIEVGSGAAPYDSLAAFMGRRPGWNP
jgi:uncharacterized protein (TIGR03086 family)